MDLPHFKLKNTIRDFVVPALREGDLDACIQFTNSLLSKVSKSSFHMVRTLDFTTCPEDTAKKFDHWTLKQEQLKPFGSAYTETNGFTSNTNQWHLHWFAYEGKPKDQNIDYLRNGDLAEGDDLIVLTGMEELQRSFQAAGEAGWVKDEEFARDICECAVVFKFMRFVQSVAARMKHLRQPLVVSSHGWDDTFLIIPPTPTIGGSAGAGGG